MPNGYDKNWFRLLAVLNSFYQTFGKWPERVAVAPMLYRNLRTNLFSPSAWEALQSRLPITEITSPPMVAEGAGHQIVLGGTPQYSEPREQFPLTESADRWLGVAPDIPELALYLGIDVGLSVGCAYALIDEKRQRLASGWVDVLEEEVDAAADEIVELARSLQQTQAFERMAIGIDAPREPLPSRRAWKYQGKWIPLPEAAKGYGRHCEIMVSALGLANPQWTPDALHAPPWMQLGFRIFQALKEGGFETYEVFPSASYGQLGGEDFRLEISTVDLLPRPKDMLDAYVAAVTVAEYKQDRGCAVGGGDGLGTIILPRPVDLRRHAGIDRWPQPSVPSDDA